MPAARRHQQESSRQPRATSFSQISDQSSLTLDAQTEQHSIKNLPIDANFNFTPESSPNTASGVIVTSSEDVVVTKANHESLHEVQEQKLTKKTLELHQKNFVTSRKLLCCGLEQTFAPHQWLTDASITFIYSLFMDCGLDVNKIRQLDFSLPRKEGAWLPDSILLMDPAVAFWLTLGDDSCDVLEAKKGFKLDERKVIICPINDNWDGGRADGGAHWSLLVGWAASRNGQGTTGESNFAFTHYNSLGYGSVSLRHAKALASRLVDRPVAVSKGACSQQSNSYDCGMYVLLFSEIIIGTMLKAGNNQLTKTGRPVWEERLMLLTPRKVTKRREQYHHVIKAVSTIGI